MLRIFVSIPFHLCVFHLTFFSKGQTVKAGNKIVIHWSKKMPDGMSYVMLGRSERLQDIYIACDGELDTTAIKCNPDALEESQRLEKIFSEAEKKDKDMRFNHWKISYLNIRSLKAHYQDVCNDNAINDSDIFGLAETWLDANESICFEGFSGYFANFGKGKGQAAFTKLDLCCEPEIISSKSCSAILLKATQFHIIFLYLSQNYDKDFVFKLLKNWVNVYTPTVVMGDVNENSLGTSKLENFMEAKGFHQLILSPTHREGAILDHLYVNEGMRKKSTFTEKKCCYYSDHDIISLYVKK